MSVLAKRGHGRLLCRRLALPILASILLPVAIGVSPTWPQEDASPQESASAESLELWSEVVERFEVVILSRGLLLEPLEEGVELRTIEISEDGVAVDGDFVGERDLRERLGDDRAELVLRLAEIDRSERRLLFESGGAVAEPETVEPAEQRELEKAEDREARAEDRRRYRDSQVAVGSSLTVEEDEVANEAVVFGGPLYVYGKVAGDAAAIGGSVTVTGEVTGDVAAIGGDLNVEAGAEILGDVVSVGGEVRIDDEARVRGQIIEVPFGPSLRFGAWPQAIFGGRHRWRGADESFELSPWGVATGFLWEAFWLVVFALLACLVLLVAKGPLERVQRRAAAEPWKSGLVGLLTQILFAPLLLLVTLILVISIIGIPLLLLIPFFILALILVAFLGYCAVAYGVGRFLANRFGWRLASPYVTLVIGVLAIQSLSLIGNVLDVGAGPLWFFAVMFGFLGVTVKYVVWTVGLGAAVLTRFGMAEGWGREVQAPPVSRPPYADEIPREPAPPPALPDLGVEPPEAPRSPDSDEPRKPSGEPEDSP